MAADLAIKERQKNHLLSLLRIKRADGASDTLNMEIEWAIAGMHEEDVALIEKIAGVKAI